MSEIELGGLRADLPIGAMAAFGVLRICGHLPEIFQPRLSWKGSGPGNVATLHTEKNLDGDALVRLLAEDVRAAAVRPELTWADHIKQVTQSEFAQRAHDVRARASAGDRSEADWFAAFGSDLVGDDEGRIESTPFDMSVARQKFLADAMRLASTLANAERGRKQKSPEQEYREALFGPWRYEDDQHSLGWDPTTIKLGAFTYKAPTSMENAGVRAAVWLAFESLPLFPCFFNRGLRTRAFQVGRQPVFRWPLWKDPIRLATLKSLLAWPSLTAKAIDGAEAHARGISAIYGSPRFKPNKYLSSFRPPELVWAAPRAGEVA